ncbi:MAG: hypothetical protein E4G90_05735 [Gemmatimonadales bacterium]|nr:MAG: hypothetical protein E4G90_05735 [Gemmatimonadales bacterium]
MKRLPVAKTFAVLCALLAAAVLFGLGRTPVQDSNNVLNLDNPGIQLMSYSRETGRIYQHVYKEGVGYHVAWQSGPLPSVPSLILPYAIVRIGDIDNDSVKEVVASMLYLTRRVVSGKRTMTEYYDFQILVFKNGCLYGAEPDIQSSLLGEMPRTIINDNFIADVDNQGTPGFPHNELVLLRSGEVDIWRATTPGIFEKIGTVNQYNYSVDVGDADNDDMNEIVVSSMDGAYPVIFKSMGLGWNRITPNPAGEASMHILAAKVRDVDNVMSDGKRDNEIIARGGNSLVVWKFEGGEYKVKFVGAELGGGVENEVDVWDSDQDGNTEVLVTGSTLKGKRIWPVLTNYSYFGGTYVPVGTYASPLAVYNDFVTGDLDGDGLNEVAVLSGSGLLKVLDFSGVDFQTVYSPATNFSQKVEIR